MLALVSHRISGPRLGSGQREEMLKEGWKSVGRVFILALVLDIVYQVIVLRFVYPGEAIIVAFILAILPYLILRGVITRLARSNYARRLHDRQTPLHGSQGSR